MTSSTGSTVTLVFTVIENSTGLLETLADAGRAVARRALHRLIRAAGG